MNLVQSLLPQGRRMFNSLLSPICHHFQALRCEIGRDCRRRVLLQTFSGLVLFSRGGLLCEERIGTDIATHPRTFWLPRVVTDRAGKCGRVVSNAQQS